jgi:ceramide glucosyltransferase
MNLELEKEALIFGDLMGSLAAIALIYCSLMMALHLVTIALALYRVSKAKRKLKANPDIPYSVIRPVCGLDSFEEDTLRSTFELATRDYEIIFCAARENDAVVPLVRRLIKDHPNVRARLLIKDERPTANPKLNNIVKGWAAAEFPWIAIADNNVLMPAHYLDELRAAFRPGVGLVCSPPVGSRPEGPWAELECAFLNTYQARWQLAADTIGFGFAQGKSMLWHRDLLDKAGGIGALGREIAEDAAATKIVRSAGLKVRLVDRPFEQPLGQRSARQVWDRQVRWARLRRATFRIFYVPELLSGGLLPIVAGVGGAFAMDADPVASLALLLAIWYGAEAALAKVAGWHMTSLSPLAWATRDVLLPLLWLQGWSGDSFVWRGNDMSVAKTRPQPQVSTA